jgi:hypothetical protein
MVHHISGDEADCSPDNLTWACRPCNVSIGIMMARVGIGKRTVQYNPADHEGAKSLAQWVTAVTSLQGHGPMDVQGAVDLVSATPPGRRSSFAKEIWRLRRAHGTDKTAVPF